MAGYLTWLHLTGSSALCTGVGGCEDVQYSIYADMGGIPVALIGLLGYPAVMGTLLLERGRSLLGADNASLLLFGLTLVGTLFSAYLTYLEFFVIHALCPYCIASAVIMVLLLAIAILRLVLMMKEEPIA